MKKFFEDFKAFALKGNVLDMAVGVIIGGAFGKIVSSLVADIITPLIGKVTGGASLVDMKYELSAEVVDAAGNVVTPANYLMYGNFLQTVIDFFIISLSIFIILRVMMNTQKKLEALAKKKKEEEIVEETPAEPEETELSLLKEIRDLMVREKE